jgi:hypothetical protein
VFNGSFFIFGVLNHFYSLSLSLAFSSKGNIKMIALLLYVFLALAVIQTLGGHFELSLSVSNPLALLSSTTSQPSYNPLQPYFATYFATIIPSTFSKKIVATISSSAISTTLPLSTTTTQPTPSITPLTDLKSDGNYKIKQKETYPRNTMICYHEGTPHLCPITTENLAASILRQKVAPTPQRTQSNKVVQPLATKRIVNSSSPPPSRNVKFRSNDKTSPQQDHSRTCLAFMAFILLTISKFSYS